MSSKECAQILAHTDLVALIREHGGELRYVGDRHVGRWPFHAEKTASGTVWDDHFHYFSCGTHGTAIDLVMQMFGVVYPAAVSWLAAKADPTCSDDRSPCPGLPAPNPRREASAEREHTFDELRVLWTERKELTALSLGSPLLQGALLDDLGEIAEQELRLAARFSASTAVANGRDDA